MNEKPVDKLREYILDAHTYGLDKSWCIGYVTAFYNTGLITNHERNDINIMITDLYTTDLT